VGAAGELIGFAGPFFAVDVHHFDDEPSGAWRPLAVLMDGSGALALRIRAVQGALGLWPGGGHRADAVRVAASVTHLGLAARLIAPVLGAAVAAGRQLDVDLDRVWWRDELGGAFPLSIPQPAEPLAPIPIDGFVAAVVEALLQPLVAAVAGAAALSPRVLWGNTASAINGAATMMAREQPGLEESAYRWAGAFLTQPAFIDEPNHPGPDFRRRSCCLIYRAAQPDASATPDPRQICGDCVLNPTEPVPAPR
jgi:hypothetical protein